MRQDAAGKMKGPLLQDRTFHRTSRRWDFEKFLTAAREDGYRVRANETAGVNLVSDPEVKQKIFNELVERFSRQGVGSVLFEVVDVVLAFVDEERARCAAIARNQTWRCSSCQTHENIARAIERPDEAPPKVTEGPRRSIKNSDFETRIETTTGKPFP